MSKHRPWSRRAFLKGIGGVSVGLPLLSSLPGRAFAADDDPFPKRLVIFFSPNGTIPPQWEPKGEGRNFELSRILTPLAPHKDDIAIIQGVDMMSAKHGPGDGHQTGMGHMLTARELLEGDLFEGGGGGFAGWASGPSVDQVIASEVGKTNKFKSLELGVQVHGSTVWSRMSYLAANQPIPPENNPQVVFDRVYADVDADPQELARIRKRRKSVLDRVRAQYRSVMPKLGSFDRVKLDQHLTAIREVERRLSINTTGVTDYCVVPELGGGLDHMAPQNFELMGHAQMDILVGALSCDLTRVATVQFSQSVSQHNFGAIGVHANHHDLSHEPDGNPDAQEALTKINTWYAEQFAYLIAKLKSVPEGGGTMLDNTVAVWVNELGKGNSHSRDRVPYVYAGSCGGTLKTGEFFDFILTPHNDFLLTLIRAMGLKDTTFGDRRFSNGVLTSLLK